MKKICFADQLFQRQETCLYTDDQDLYYGKWRQLLDTEIYQ